MGWLPGRLILLRLLNGSGPAGAASVEGSWLLLLLLACVVGVGVVGCRVSGVGDTPACFCFLLVWGVGCGGCPRVVWGWHAVGVLGQCALVAWLVWGSWLWGFLGGCGWVGCELYSGREHLTVRFLRQSVSCFVRVSLLFVFLSVRWMPWHQGPMKDVVACDIPRGAGWRAVIRGFPNGGTRHELCRVTCI